MKLKIFILTLLISMHCGVGFSSVGFEEDAKFPLKLQGTSDARDKSKSIVIPKSYYDEILTNSVQYPANIYFSVMFRKEQPYTLYKFFVKTDPNLEDTDITEFLFEYNKLKKQDGYELTSANHQKFLLVTRVNEGYVDSTLNLAIPMKKKYLSVDNDKISFHLYYGIGSTKHKQNGLKFDIIPKKIFNDVKDDILPVESELNESSPLRIKYKVYSNIAHNVEIGPDASSKRIKPNDDAFHYANFKYKKEGDKTSYLAAFKMTPLFEGIEKNQLFADEYIEADTIYYMCGYYFTGSASEIKKILQEKKERKVINTAPSNNSSKPPVPNNKYLNLRYSLERRGYKVYLDGNAITFSPGKRKFIDNFVEMLVAYGPFTNKATVYKNILENNADELIENKKLISTINRSKKYMFYKGKYWRFNAKRITKNDKITVILP